MVRLLAARLRERRLPGRRGLVTMLQGDLPLDGRLEKGLVLLEVDAGLLLLHLCPDHLDRELPAVVIALHSDEIAARVTLHHAGHSGG